MSHRFTEVLDDNGSTDGQGLTGRQVCALTGDFGGGTLVLEYSADDGDNYVEIPDASYTDETVFEVSCGTGGIIRATLSGATDPDLSVSFGRIAE